MKISGKGKQSVILLGSALLSVGLLPEEATSILLLVMIFWVWMQEMELGPIRKPIMVLGLLVANGLLMAWRHPVENVIKDFWYFGLPMITILTGWACAGKANPRATFRMVYLISGVYSLYFIATAVYYISSGEVLLGDQYGLRQLTGPGEIISAWGCLMIFARPLGNGELTSGFKGFIVPIFCINIVAIILSGSRTSLSLLLLGLFFAIIPSLISKSRRKMYWIVISGTAISIILFGIFIAPQFADPRTAIGRLANIFRELFNFDFYDVSDINQKYRAYESMMALKSFFEGNPFEYIFGQGFGALVDLQVLQGLGWGTNIVEFQFIPILHNGYLMLLVKTGLSGFILFSIFLYQLMQMCRLQIKKELGRFWPSMAMAILVGTIFATFVISGPFGKGTFFTSFIVLGVCLRQALYPFNNEPGKGVNP